MSLFSISQMRGNHQLTSLTAVKGNTLSQLQMLLIHLILTPCSFLRLLPFTSLTPPSPLPHPSLTSMQPHPSITSHSSVTSFTPPHLSHPHILYSLLPSPTSLHSSLVIIHYSSSPFTTYQPSLPTLPTLTPHIFPVGLLPILKEGAMKQHMQCTPLPPEPAQRPSTTHHANQ